MINGLRTVKFPVADLDKAKSWFIEVFGTGLYFDQPFYVGFAIGGVELGLVPDGTPSTSGSVAYWELTTSRPKSSASGSLARPRTRRSRMWETASRSRN